MNLNGKVTNPGDLRTRITLKPRSVSAETGGFQRPVYGVGVQAMARWVNVHGPEAWTADMAGAIAPATVTIRHRIDLNETWAVEKNGELFEIVSIDNIQERNEYLELKVKRMRAG